MVRLSRCARRRIHSDTALTPRPITATASIRPDAIVGRIRQPLPRLVEHERRDAEQQDRVRRPRRGSPGGGSRTSARRSAGRAANEIASRARPIPTTSVSTWPASASSARLFEATPPTTSMTRTPSVSPKTSRSRSRLACAALWSPPMAHSIAPMPDVVRAPRRHAVATVVRGCTGPSDPAEPRTIGAYHRHVRGRYWTIEPDRRVPAHRDTMRHAHPIERPRDRMTALLRAGLVAALALAILPLPAFAADGDPPAEPTPTVEPTPEPTPARRPTGVQSVLYYRSPAVVRQYKNYWCVPAATQTMWNLLTRDVERDVGSPAVRSTRQIRMHNRYRYTTNGNDIQGWAWALRHYTGQPYDARAFTSQDDRHRAPSSRRSTGPVTRSGSPSTTARTPGSSSATRPQPSADGPDQADDPRASTSAARSDRGSRDPWKYRYLSMASFRKVYGKYHEWHAQGHLGRHVRPRQRADPGRHRAGGRP